jgi:hypothetical protein
MRDLIMLGFAEESVVTRVEGLWRDFYVCRPAPGFVAGYWIFGDQYDVRIWPARDAVGPADFMRGWERGTPLVDAKCDSILQVQAVIFDFVQKQEHPND